MGSTALGSLFLGIRLASALSYTKYAKEIIEIKQTNPHSNKD